MDFPACAGKNMKWVCGVVREGDLLQLQLQTGKSGVRLESVKNWRSESQTTRRAAAPSVEINFDNFRRVELQNYVCGLEMAWLRTEAQTGFEATVAGKTIVIPSQLMIMSLLGASLELRCSLMAPLHTNQWLAGLIPHGQLIAKAGKHRPTSLSTLVREQWIATDRSASASFGSVYRHALDGRFDLDLPSGVGTFDLVGREVRGTLLVTKLTSLSMFRRKSAEDSFFTDVQHHYFHKRSNPEVRATQGPTALEDARLRFVTFSKLTDAQWLRARAVLADRPGVEGLTFGDSRRPCSLRDCLDCIRFKFGSPCAWKDMKGDVSANQAYWVYRRIVQANLWDELIDAIRQQ